MNLKKPLQIAVLFQIAGSLFFLAAIAYLGTFTRYMSDDYCEAYETQTYSPLGAVLNRYEDGNWRAANRFSNLLFAGVVDSFFGLKSMEIIPAALIVLWVTGLIALVRQVRTLAGVQWHMQLDVFFGAMLAFISILEAPNRYQTFYWRSSMATHFAPLVFLNLLVAFLLFKLRSNGKASLSIWTALFIFLASFMIGGFSEPPVTVMIVGSGLGIVFTWFFVKNEKRRVLLSMLGGVFAGAVSALTVMAVSPAVSKLGADAPSFIEWVQRTAQYTYLFTLDTFKTLPLPLFITVISPAVLAYVIYREKADSISINAKTLRIIALTLPFILILLIAAGFSTSAYGQAYPVTRARFFAHYLMTITLVVEGVFLGIWVAQFKLKFLNNVYFAYLPLLALLILSAYPFRAGWQAMQEVPEYSAREQNWDRRDAHIYKLREVGQVDLTVPQFDGVDGVKELDSYETHWVNVCAAKYYQVNSIRAIPIHGAEALEEYYDRFSD